MRRGRVHASQAKAAATDTIVGKGASLLTQAIEYHCGDVGVGKLSLLLTVNTFLMMCDYPLCVTIADLV